jgi:hypothetical protein
LGHPCQNKAGRKWRQAGPPTPPPYSPACVWFGAAGRIDFVSDENVLIITFPDGHISKQISRMMLDAKP